MKFEKYLKNNAQKVEKELKKQLNQFLEETKKTNLELLPFAQKLVNACSGGKRIRGVLCYLGYQLAGGKGNEIYKISASLEILHTALLIHDDIIDKSPTRRGKPSLYKALGGNHYGISQAISLGDIGLYLPLKIIAGSRFDEKTKIKVLSRLSQIIINTGWGQIMDVFENGDKEFVDLYKTAKYTITAPLQIGAILAGEEKLAKNLNVFGESLGIAFQIKDDILDNEVKNTKQAKMQAEKYMINAKKMISGITDDIATKRLLEQMCEYMIQRRK